MRPARRALSSAFLPGLGQLLAGRRRAAAAWLVVALSVWVLGGPCAGPIVHLAAAIDGYRVPRG